MTGDLSACKSKRTLIQLLTINTRAYAAWRPLLLNIRTPRRPRPEVLRSLSDLKARAPLHVDHMRAPRQSPARADSRLASHTPTLAGPLLPSLLTS
jgi:hypothetical protein